MKTNQHLSVPFELGTLDVEHKTLMGDLRNWFALGTEYRRRDGREVKELAGWLRLQSTQEFIETVTDKIGRPSLVTSRGRGQRMKAHLYIMLDAAAFLSPAFKLEVYEVFVQQRLCELRDEGGNLFVEVNAALKTAATAVLGKPAHQGHYITLAKIIKQRCGVDDWNLADGQAHAKRSRIEDRLASALDFDLVRDWDHLKELAERV